MNLAHKKTENESISMQSEGTFAALQFPNYRLWFFGQMVSLVGTWMQTTAQGFLIYSLTGSSAMLGMITFVNGIPVWLLTMYGGLISDRVSRRTLLIITQSSMMLLAFVMAGLVFTGLIQPWHIAVLSFLLGVANAFDAPARQSFVRELVDKDHMTNAIALNATMFNIGTVVGPAVAGLTYAAVGPGWCFTINGITFVAVILALALMKIEPFKSPERNGNNWQEMKDGIHYVWNNQVIRGLIASLGILSALAFGMVSQMPAWAVDVLHGDASTNGWLLSARGVGSLLGGLILATFATKRFRGKLWSYSSFVLPFFFIGFAWATQLRLSLLLMGFVGLFMILITNLTNAMVQSEVDDTIRGRVMGIYTMIFMGLAPIGSLVEGIAMEHIGAQWTVTICGILMLLSALFFRIKLPYLRDVK